MWAAPTRPRYRLSTVAPFRIALTLAGAAAGVLAFTLGGCSRAPEPSWSTEPAAAALRQLTGAHTRVVWVQDAVNHGDLFGRRGLDTVLLGLDTDDGTGERAILPQAGGYTKPMLTPAGDRVVFTQFRRGIPRLGSWQPGDKVMFSRTRHLEVRVVDWDGNNVRTIAPGYALDVWADPRTGREWVYLQAGRHRAPNLQYNSVYRVPLDEPDKGELVWDASPVDAMGEGNFQVSADGRRAVGLLPWPDAALLNLETGTWERLGTGCWPSLAPDNSYRPWIFDGAHRHLLMSGHGGRIAAKISITAGAGMPGAEAYHPRWSNHPDIVTFTGPWHLRGGDKTQVTGAEVRVGRLDDTFSRLASSVRVTTNQRGDYFPDVWVELPAEHAGWPEHTALNDARDERADTWPGDVGGLIFRWENAQAKNQVTSESGTGWRTCRVAPHEFAHFGPHHEMRLVGTSRFTSSEGENAMVTALRETNTLTFEASITPAGPTPSRAVIAALASAGTAPQFALEQDGIDISFSILVSSPTGPLERRLSVGALAPGTTHHVAATYADYEFAVFVNGRKVASERDKHGRLDGWTPAPLVFGGTMGGQAYWQGLIDGVALYSVCLDANQIAAHAGLNAQRLAGRQAPDQVEMLAVLREITPTPAADAIAPYQRCLVVYHYDVQEVLAGDFAEKEILVAHWGLLDGLPVFDAAPALGTTLHLTVEPFEQHPQLISERLDMAPTAFDLPMFYDPAPRAANWPWFPLGGDRERRAQPWMR